MSQTPGKCQCEALSAQDGGMIVLCNLHAAAPELLAALNEIKYCLINGGPEALNQALKVARVTVAHAEQPHV